MAVPYTFGNATTSIPLSQLDTNFATAITIGNTAVYLGNTTTTFGNVTLNNVTINSGNSTVSSASISGNLTFTGTGNRITGDFSNATAANRVSFQSSTTNGNTIVPIIPNGTATQTNLVLYNGSDVTTNFNLFTIRHNTTASTFASSIGGTGAYVPMTFETGGSERMRIDTSGNVGIGTTSTGQGRLTVYSGTAGSPATTGSTDPNIASRIQVSSVALDIGTYFAGQTWIQNRQFNNYATNYDLVLQPNGGNVGIGTSSPSSIFDVQSATSIIRNTATTGTNQVAIRQGNTGGFFYTGIDTSTGGFLTGANYAAFHWMSGAYPMIFATNNSERMRIDSSGNVGIGTSSPGSRLDVVRSDSEIVTQAICSNANKYSFVRTYNSNQASNTIDYGVNNDGSGLIIVRAAPTSGTKAFTLNYGPLGDVLAIDTSGNVGIGTSSPTGFGGTNLNIKAPSSSAYGSILVESGSYVWEVLTNQTGNVMSMGSRSNHSLTIATNDTERMRIDTSGNLLVGNTVQVWDERVLGYRTTNNVVGGFYSSSNAYTSSVIRCQTETAAGTGWYFFEGRASGGSFQYGIRGNGTVATSDARRKKNIEPARSYLEDVCSIPVVKYNWKADADDAPKELGWLAQDVEKVFPNMVVTHYDGPNDDQEVLLLKKEVFVPMLMKCIQELKAELDALKGTK